jgi:hypothetical protein
MPDNLYDFYTDLKAINTNLNFIPSNKDSLFFLLLISVFLVFEFI